MPVRSETANKPPRDAKKTDRPAATANLEVRSANRRSGTGLH
jgi:hypothetical protein